MSPKKALQPAMLKSRFADTTLKAQQKTLLDHVDKADMVKLLQEKEKMERMQREEKAKLEAQIRAAEAAARMKAEAELKRERELEREAARLALQKMGKTVEIEQNLEIIKELEMLIGCCLSSYQFHGRKCVPRDRVDCRSVWCGNWREPFA
ncbi:transcription factor GTE12-like [Hibiscus syriacus]|nr:transcription factor GTE12-like [Hibiscus syriacus]